MSDEKKNARYAITVLFGINFMNFFDRQIAGALGEPIRIEFGLNDTQLGLLATAFMLVYAAVGVPVGRLTDRGSRKRLIAIAPDDEGTMMQMMQVRRQVADGVG